MNRRSFLGYMSLIPTLAHAQETEGVNTFSEDLSFFSASPNDPDRFKLCRKRFPIVEHDYFYQGKRIALLSDMLHVSANIHDIDRRYVRVAKDGTHTFYFKRRPLTHDQADFWRGVFIKYRDKADWLPHYSVDAALLFATWIVSTELEPVVGFATGAVGLWELLTNAYNDFRGTRDAQHIIDTAKGGVSFIFSQLEFKPNDPQHCALGVFYQGNTNDRAIALWMQTYHNMVGFPLRPDLIEGWS